MDCYYGDDEHDYCDRYYVDDYDDEYDVEGIIAQPTEIERTIYSGQLLISEIILQDNRMYCLASAYLLIADIDCGDRTKEPLKILTAYVEQNGGSFRVYKTLNGMRYLQTDVGYARVNNSAIATLQALGSDQDYVKLSQAGKRFMARLTPKLDSTLALKYFEQFQRGIFPDCRVTNYLKTIGTGEINPLLKESVTLHDRITQAHQSHLPLK